jgi:hypothetical protein
MVNGLPDSRLLDDSGHLHEISRIQPVSDDEQTTLAVELAEWLEEGQTILLKRTNFDSCENEAVVSAASRPK